MKILFIYQRISTINLWCSFANISFSNNIFCKPFLSNIFTFENSLNANSCFVLLYFTYQIIPKRPFPITYKNSKWFLFTKILLILFNNKVIFYFVILLFPSLYWANILFITVCPIKKLLKKNNILKNHLNKRTLFI